MMAKRPTHPPPGLEKPLPPPPPPPGPCWACGTPGYHCGEACITALRQLLREILEGASNYTHDPGTMVATLEMIRRKVEDVLKERT